jgi:hypothetical protein
MNARLHFHWNRLIEDLNPARPAVQQFLDAHANRLESLIRVIQSAQLSSSCQAWCSAKH